MILALQAARFTNVFCASHCNRDGNQNAQDGNDQHANTHTFFPQLSLAAVRNAGFAIDGGVHIYDTSGNWVSSGYTDSSGNYTAGGLPTGNYFAVSYNYSGGYVDELYDNFTCSFGNCDPTTGTPVAVTVSNDTPSINFALDFGGSFSGMVTDAATNLPIGSFINI